MTGDREGPTAISTIRDAGDGDAVASVPCRLEVVQTPDPALRGAVTVLRPDEVLCIGRDVEDGLKIRDPKMSRLHVRIVWDPVLRGFRYGDAGSANGTFVNGDTKDSGPLLPGDVLRMGDTLLVCIERDLGAELAARVLRAARSVLSVLIRGETGTGKELLARTLHRESGRTGAFVAVNCAALPPDLAAAELFGHTRGAFSGAAAARAGLVRAADGGTLLLDEIGDLSIELQGQLLRSLQERTVRPVGSDTELAVDVRVVAATHVDLEEATRRGRFRQDLLQRLTQIVLDVPPLRQRRTDILRLASEFAPGLGLSAGAAEALLLWDWPGNVRELRALIESSAVMKAGAEPLRAADLAHRIPSAADVVVQRQQPADRQPSASPTAAERRVLLAGLLEKHDANISQVARELGKPRAQVYRWLRALGLNRKRQNP